MPRSWQQLVPPVIKDAVHTGSACLRLLRQEGSPAPLFTWIRKVGPVSRRASLLSEARRLQLYRLALLVARNRVPGDVVECGVAGGGSAVVLGASGLLDVEDRDLWLFDSFQGLPAPGERDGPRSMRLQGECAADQEDVAAVLREAGVPPKKTHLVGGWFAATFPESRIYRVCFLHIDADWYDSVKLCLDRFYDRLSRGAVVVLDDYDDWPGCRSALEDFQRERNLRFDIVRHGAGAAYFQVP
ncbi:MAG: TylF/MycF/NovP-related O-methyltransferase [Terriglobales bacterium]